VTPRASRTAISRRRPIARTSKRFATFAHAISSTISDTAPSSFETRISGELAPSPKERTDLPGRIELICTSSESGLVPRLLFAA
jgi:hypothetical protein